MTRALGALFVTALTSVGVAACGADPNNLDWGFRFETPTLRARAAVIEAKILSGSCTGAAVFTVEIPVTGAMSVAASRPGVLAAGRYGLSGVARDTSCTVIAEGCREVELPAAAEMRQIVTLSAAGARPACDPSMCSNGSCAGLDAGGPPDAGQDAGTDAGDFDAGPLFDAGPPPVDAGPPPPVDAGPPPFDAAMCAAGTADCDVNGSCETNTNTDDNHCGRCGRRCFGMAFCAAGSCACMAPYVSDGLSGCTDPRSDPNICGAGAIRCDNDQICLASTCVCRPGLESIGGGTCTDLQTDPNNCGAVGVDCSLMGTMVTCRGGTCQDACTAGQTNCSNHCVDLNVDPTHCGSCLNDCSQDQVCVSGNCRDYEPALGCTMCPCASCGFATPTCCTYGGNTICTEGSTCATVMP